MFDAEILFRLAFGAGLTRWTEREMSVGLSAGRTPETADRDESGGGQDDEMLLVYNSEC